MSKQSIGTVLIDVQADTQKLVTGFNKAEKTVSKATDTMKKTIIGLTTAYLSLEGVNAFNGMVKGSIDAADSLSELAEKLAISTSSLSELEYTAGFAGVSIGQLNAAMSAMIRRTGNFKSDGTGAAVKALDELGISVEFARENFTDTRTTFDLLIDKLRGVEDGTLRTKLAQDLFSKSASDVVRIAGMSANQLRILGDEGRRSGAIISNEFGENAGAVNESLDKLNFAILGLKNNLASELSPGLVETADGLTKNIPVIIDTTNEIIHLSIVLGSTTLAFKAYSTISKIATVSNLALGGSYGAVNRSIILAATSQKIFSTVLRATPFALVATTVYLLSDAFLDNREKAEYLEKAYSGVSENLKDLTANQLEYRKSLLQTELIQARLDLSNAKADVGSNGFFESEEEKKKDLAHLDEVRQRFNNLRKATVETKRALKGIFKSNDEDTPSTPKAYSGKIKDKNSQKDILTTSLSDWQNYYERIGDLGTAWLIKESQLNNQYVDLNKQQLESMIALEKENYFNTQKSYEAYVNIVGTDYDKWLQNTNNRLVELAKTGTLTSEQLQEVYDVLDTDNKISLIDEDTNTYTSMLDSQMELIDSTNEWQNGLEGVAGAIGGVSTAFVKMAKDNLLYSKQQRKLDSKYEKEKLKYSKDDKKLHKAKQDYEKDSAKLKQTSFENELTGYVNLAGAASGMFEEHETGYKALQAVQIGLQLAIHATALAEAMAASTSVASSAASTAATMTEAGANATASVTAAGKGDPYSAPARVLAMIALMASAMTMFGGGGGGSGGSSGKSSYDINRDNIEASYSPTLDRLDRQIELLESIDRNGTAAQLSVKQSGVTFEKDYKLFVEDALESTYRKTGVGFIGTEASNQFWKDQALIEKLTGIDAFSTVDRNTKTYVNYDVLRQGDNLLKVLDAMNEHGVYEMFGVDDEHKESSKETREALFKSTLSDLQGVISNYTMSLFKSLNDLEDASDDFKEIFDDITGTTTYETKRLTQAYDEVNKVKGDKSLSNYLVNQIEEIEKIEKLFQGKNFELLLSQDPSDMQEQIALLKELENATGKTFADGSAEALNYLESIRLVGEGMSSSRENIKDFKDNFKSEDSLANDLASNLGLTLAKDFGELNNLFSQLSSDVLGLTDIETEFLEENKSYIERINEARIEAFESELDAAKNNISTIESLINDLDSSSEKLKNEAYKGTTFGIDKFYASMNESLNLSTTNKYEDFAKSLEKTINYSSALLKSSNFTNENDMRFAQLVAANQFDSMEVSMESELGKLENTVKNLSDKIEEQNSQMIELQKQIAENTEVDRIA